MTEKLEKKIRKLLAKAEVSEEKIDELVAEIEKGDVIEEKANPEATEPVVEEENPVSPAPTEEQGEGVPPELPVEPTEGDVPPSDVPPTDIPPVAPSEDVPPETDGSIEQALNGLVAQEPDQQPLTPEVPQIPQVDPHVEELVSKVEELSKANEGLLARIDSLEDALKKAGLIEGGTSVGDETPRVTPNANQDDVDYTEEILRTINGK